MRAALAALLLTVGLALFVLLPSCEDQRVFPRGDTWIDLLSIHEEGAQLDEAVVKLRRFQAVQRQAEEDLLKGTRTLAEAAEVVLESARYDNPQLLRWVERNVPARTDHERMMRVLLGRLSAAEMVGLLSPAQKDQLDCLRCELASALALK